MGVALGWMALALSLVGQTNAGRGGVPIKYTVRFLEVEGLGWRDPVFARLTPVTRQGAATVWTAPSDVARRMAQYASKSPSSRVVQPPKIAAWPGAPAHFTTRSDRRLVTQVAWDGEENPAAPRPEWVSSGSTATMAGRKLDQGILVRMVLKDTQIIAVHRVPVADHRVAAAPVPASDCCDAGPEQATTDPATKQAAHEAENPDCCEAAEKSITANLPKLSIKFALPSGRYMIDDVKFFPSSAEASHAAETSGKPTCEAVAKSVSVEVPEIGSQEIAGEWLIPKDGILLVSFGPHTVADEDGKAVIRERLAIVEADESTGPINAPAHPPKLWGSQGMNVPTLQPPTILGVVPAPTTSGMARPMPADPLPSSNFAPTPMPGTPPAAMPPMPSRSIPQGYHSDGKAAALPPLPADEDDDHDADDSAEPRPSLQGKKPRPVEEPEVPKPRPSADAGMKKAQFTFANMPGLPTLFQPAPAIGLQFLLPIKPFSVKLPFNRRLEIEIYGRVVPAPAPAHSPAELATKSGATTR